MARLYLISGGLELGRRRPIVPRGRMLEAWADHYAADDYWIGEESKMLLDSLGTPIPPRLTLDSASVPIYYGPRLQDVESLPFEDSLRARVLSAHGIAVAWITMDAAGRRTTDQPQSVADPVFFLRRPGGDAVHIWRLFSTRDEAITYMSAHYGADPEAVPWARSLPAADYQDLLERCGVRDDAAEERLLAAVRRGENVETLLELAALYRSQGRYTAAEPLFQRALSIQERALGPEHIELATPLAHLASLYVTRGDYAGAEPLYRRVLTIIEATLGHEHPDLAATLESYGTLLRKMGREAEAVRMGARAKSIQAKESGGRG
jgi:tetratricopeptide (TPR) repeat protein